MSKDKDEKLFKIIDWKRKGHLVRFYLGDKDCTDYTGDDWDDRPYEHNAEMVYSEYIKAYLDMVFPFEFSVMEPADGHDNSTWSKDDMKAHKVPCIVVAPKEDYPTFEDALADPQSEAYYLGDYFSSRDNAIQYIEEEEK